MDVSGHAVSVPGIAALGIVVGFIAGMFGVGGGFLLTPLLNVVFGIPLPIAVGTGLCQMIGTSTAALLRHRRIGQGEIRFDLLMLGGSLFGVDAGTRAVTALADAGSVAIGGERIALVVLVLDISYVTLLAGIARIFWMQSGSIEALDYVRFGPLSRVRFGPAIDLPAIPLRRVSALVVAFVGLALGFLSGMLGIGGGVALMPVLIYGFGFPIRQAAGTGILVLVVSAAFGTVEHAVRGHVDLRLATVLMVGSTLSAQVGALATRRLRAGTLRRLFAGILLLTSATIAWHLVSLVR